MTTAKKATKRATKTPQRKHQTKPTPAPASAATATARPRRLYLPVYKLLRLKRVQHPVVLPSVWQLSKKTTLLLWRHRGLFLWLGAVYTILNVFFVRGLSGSADVNSLKSQVGQGLQGNTAQLTTGLSAFTGLLASSGNGSSTTAGVYQIMLGLIVSLAVIWALRQAAAGEPMRLKDPFYRGMYPLVPFILVVLVILLQTVPFLVGAGLYGMAMSYGIAINLTEKVLWGLLFAVLTLISVYMLCSSLFALYVVTLPDMTPWKALKNARQLVHYRRPAVFRKLLFLPFALLVIAGVIMAPIVLLVPAAATWAFFLLGMFTLILAHAYLYTLYRELLA
jgi:hypothetical protein